MFGFERFSCCSCWSRVGYHIDISHVKKTNLFQSHTQLAFNTFFSCPRIRWFPVASVLKTLALTTLFYVLIYFPPNLQYYFIAVYSRETCVTWRTSWFSFYYFDVSRCTNLNLFHAPPLVILSLQWKDLLMLPFFRNVFNCV